MADKSMDQIRREFFEYLADEKDAESAALVVKDGEKFLEESEKADDHDGEPDQ